MYPGGQYFKITPDLKKSSNLEIGPFEIIDNAQAEGWRIS